MSIQSGVGRRPTPMIPKSIQPDGVHSASHDFNLSMQTEGLYWYDSVSRHSYVWPSYDGAPWVKSSSVDSDVNFQIGDDSGGEACDLEIPWFSQKGVEQVRVYARIVIFDQDVDFEFGIKASTLVTSVTTATGARQPNPQTASAQSIPWRGKVARAFMVVAFATVAPNYPSDRCISIVPYCRWATAGSNPTNTSTERRARIYCMKIEDLLPTPQDF